MSAVATSSRAYTPDDLSAMPDGEMYELVDGRLLPRHLDFLSRAIALRLGHRVVQHCMRRAFEGDRKSMAWTAGPGAGYRCFPNLPDRVRRPDVSIVLPPRMGNRGIEDGYITVAPDLIAEVVTPHDLANDFHLRLNDYHEAGVRLIWIVYPNRRKIEVWRKNGPICHLGPDDELTGEDILPDFRCRVADLFAGLPETTA